MDVEHPAAATTMDVERQNVAHPAAAAADGEDRNNSDGVTSAAPANVDAEAAAPSVTTSTSNRFESDSMRAKFDHSSRKVVVHNVLKFMRSKDVTKLTSSWINQYNSSNSNHQIQIVNARKPPKDSWIKVTLAHEEMVAPFITFINSGGKDGNALVNERGRPLFAKRVDEMLDHDDNDDAHEDDEGEEGYSNTADGRKRKGTDQANATPVDNDSNSNNGSDNNGNNKRFKSDTQQKASLSDDEVRDAITPLWRLSYEEQLSSKIREMVNKCANKIVKEIKAKFRTLEKEAKRGHRKEVIKLYGWLNQNRAINMQQPVPSPRTSEYRNKVEFTFGYRLVPDENEVVDGSEGGGVNVVNDTDEASATTATNERHDNAHDVVDASSASATTNAGESDVPNLTNTNNYRQVPAVGFLAQGWAGGVYPPHPLQNIPNWSCSIADILNTDFLPKSSIPPYDSKTHRGVWRSVTIRASLRTKECMVIVLHAPAKGGAGAREDGSDDYSSVFEEEKARLIELLTQSVLPVVERSFPKEDHDGSEDVTPVSSLKGDDNEAENGIRVTSIFFQEYEGLSNPGPDHPVQHIYGKEFIEEKLGNCTFQISPGAFFQVNTDGAEVLYNIVVDRIREVTSDPMQTLLLDVCCGTGTIGLTCLKEGVVGKLVGVDIAEPAIADAKLNASKNGYTDKSLAQFIASPAEKILPDIMRDIPRNTPVVAVVDPARDGLHGIVVRALRANEKIQRLVYVSCNPIGTLTRDAAMLCGPPTKKYPGIPFKPTMAQPVDMFPLTKHCEMVMTFDRMSKEEYEKHHS